MNASRTGAGEGKKAFEVNWYRVWWKVHDRTAEVRKSAVEILARLRDLPKILVMRTGRDSLMATGSVECG